MIMQRVHHNHRCFKDVTSIAAAVLEVVVAVLTASALAIVLAALSAGAAAIAAVTVVASRIMMLLKMMRI